MHVGGGRAGFSTGAGPVSFYTSLGGGRRGGRSGGNRSSGSSTASYQRQVLAQQRQAAQAQRIEEARRLTAAFLHIINLHRTDFPPAAPPVAPPAGPPDTAVIRRHYEQHALAGIGLFQRAKRAQAKQQAAAWTEAEVQRQWTESCRQRDQWQQHLDQQWQRLCANESDIVIETIEEAFEDNEVPSAAVGVSGSEVSLVALIPPGEHVVPERMPNTTEAGNLSLRKLTKRELADYYKLFVCGQVLVTVREAFAVAPGLASARVAVLRTDGIDAYGQPRVSCLLAARFERTALDGIHWASADAGIIVNDASSELIINQRGATRALTAVDLTAEPDLMRLIEAVDLSELTAGQKR